MWYNADIVNVGAAVAGSLKYMVYTSNAGTEFAVKIDESNGELADCGFRDLLPADNLPGLPKNIKMRYMNAQNPATGATRKIFAGLPSALRFVNGGVLLLNLIATATGAGALLPFTISSSIGEVVKLLNPADTGLLDGDDD